jgi:hypothetical protein
MVDARERETGSAVGPDWLFDSDDEHLARTLPQLRSPSPSRVRASRSVARPRGFFVNEAASALASVGLFESDGPSGLSQIDGGESHSLVTKLQLGSHRLGVKIGVICVRSGCDTQNEVLGTALEQTSPHFREFVTALGHAVALERHVGYSGGLDWRSGRVGRTSIYSADFVNEVMFHVAPLMPTDASDEQQVVKKKHIGNDHVHVVWCEGDRDYDVSTITSQFNQAHIVVYPLGSGLFRVEVCWRKELGWFGPLRWPLVVAKKALPSLVRASAVAAMDQFYSGQSAFAYPQGELAKASRDVIAKFAVSRGPYEAVERVMTLHCE